MAPLLIVLSGPSGVGKDTLIHKLLLTEPRMRKITTVTTRAPRPGESMAETTISFPLTASIS